MSSYRRKLQQLSNNIPHHTQSLPEEITATPSRKVSETSPKRTSSADTQYADPDMTGADTTIRNAAFHDLKKTGMMIIVILLIEFLIYYANLMGIIKI